MKRIWINKVESFRAAGELDIDYYLSMSPDERLDTMQFLREMVFKIRRETRYGKGGEGLRRTVKIVE